MIPYETARQVHAGCMVCGDAERNPESALVRFEEQEDGSMAASFLPTARHQGYDGYLHGGMTCALLDAAMTHCLFARGIRAMTAELTVRFVDPVTIGQAVTVCARLLGERHGVYQLEATMTRGQTPLARAKAKFVAPKTAL